MAARIVQSKHIANAIPITPIFKQIAKMIEKTNLASNVDAMDTIIVNFTSPAARNPLLKGPEIGYTIALNTL